MKQVNESAAKPQRKKSAAQEVFIPGLSKRPRKTTAFRDLDEESNKFNSCLVPSNVKEQRDKFMLYGLTPRFKYPRGFEPLYNASKLETYQIRTNLFNEAKAIIDKVCSVHGNSFGYVENTFGKQINQEDANTFIQKYIKAHDLDGCMTVYWSPSIIASGKMMWVGPSQKHNKPELRKYSFVIRHSPDNIYVREDGIRCLVNHEIGSHYVRFYNDGQQPWFSDRQKFGLFPQTSRKMKATEEGLATINTLLSARTKYLWGAAILYYIACKAAEMSFRQLYDHMAQYVPDKEQRWRQIVRVKRGISDVTKPGGYGHDQVYFEGAVEILRNIDHIDFNILHCGRICTDEVNRVKRMARMDCLKVPLFLKDMAKYKRMLKHIAYINGLGQRPPKPPKPVRSKSASRFKINVMFSQPIPKPKLDFELPSLLNFNFKDSPVDFIPLSLDNYDSDCESGTTYSHSFIYPNDNNFSIGDRRLGAKTSFCDHDDQVSTKSEGGSLTSRSYGRIRMQKDKRLLHRPTSSPKHIVNATMAK